MEFINQYLVEIITTISIVVIIQFLKGFKKLKTLSNDFWKVMVLIFGLLMAVVVQAVYNFPGDSILSIIGNIFFKGVLLSAASTLLYQTGKLTLKKLIKLKGE